LVIYASRFDGVVMGFGQRNAALALEEPRKRIAE